MLAEGAAAVCELADEIDAAAGARRVSLLDIGGGLHASLDSDEPSPSFEEYAACLRRAAPGLFVDDGRRVVTEFGRALLLKAGWVAAQVCTRAHVHVDVHVHVCCSSRWLAAQVEYVTHVPQPQQEENGGGGDDGGANGGAATAAEVEGTETPRRIATCEGHEACRRLLLDACRGKPERLHGASHGPISASHGLMPDAARLLRGERAPGDEGDGDGDGEGEGSSLSSRDSATATGADHGRAHDWRDASRSFRSFSSTEEEEKDRA